MTEDCKQDQSTCTDSECYRTNVPSFRYGHKGQAEKGFMTRDFFGNCYLGYMIRDLGKLRLLMMREGDKGLGFEKVMEMDCHDVGSFQHSDMFLVLDKTFTMQLFTGNQKVILTITYLFV